ncbi:CAP domain-containing protein [Bacillus sp. 37MA]|uniref:CAP domain-containing protein n=1 Tax=Bacillus sp. 37MA TaxID=1132442 RepID=UPI0003655BCD|nr:CAP domain-containing protein [Bacillus sp. 37MA]
MKKNLRMAAIAGAMSIGLFTAGQAEAATPTCNWNQPVQYKTIVKYYNGEKTVEKVQQPAEKAPVTTTQAPAEKAPVTTTQAPAEKAPVTTTQAPAEKAPATTTQAPAATTGSVSEFEKQVFELVNQERAKAGVKALQLDTKLSDVARTKSADMKNKGYFSHQSPTYGSPFDMMKQFGITYKTAGENIAKGQKTPEEVMKAWMNSDGHRKNILSADYTHIGVGYVDGHWTQMFIGK